MQEIMNIYKDIGLKQTPQRLMIFKFISENMGVHYSAEEIFNAVKEKTPTISFATVYNTLDTLVRKGKIVEIRVNPKKKHYEANLKPHHHIVCTVCEKIADVWEEAENYGLLKGDVAGFQVTGCHISLNGICESCQAV